MEKYSQVIFDKNTVEFVTVAAEFCGFLERDDERFFSGLQGTFQRVLGTTAGKHYACFA